VVTYPPPLSVRTNKCGFVTPPRTRFYSDSHGFPTTRLSYSKQPEFLAFFQLQFELRGVFYHDRRMISYYGWTSAAPAASHLLQNPRPISQTGTKTHGPGKNYSQKSFASLGWLTGVRLPNLQFPVRPNIFRYQNDPLPD